MVDAADSKSASYGVRVQVSPDALKVNALVAKQVDAADLKSADPLGLVSSILTGSTKYWRNGNDGGLRQTVNLFLYRLGSSNLSSSTTYYVIGEI